MYKVLFKNNPAESGAFVGSCRSIDEACSLALALHRSSNVPHFVTVFDVDEASVVTFEARPASEHSTPKSAN